MLNTLLASRGSVSRTEAKSFLRLEKHNIRPFPEDFAVRGLLWTEGYYPDNWFANDKIDEEEKYNELPSMTAERRDRILWISAFRIANHGHGLNFDSQRFTAPAKGLQVDSPGTCTPGTIDGETWWPSAEDLDSDLEEDMPSDRK
jgi:hypothetical protein